MTPDELDDKITEWHTSSEDGISLVEFLGWTQRQYNKWLEDGVIPDNA